MVIPLLPGENSSTFLTDTDAVVVGQGQSVDGENIGAYKIGISTVSVEGTTPKSIKIDHGVAYALNAIVGHAGYQDSATAQKNGWVPPSGKQATADSYKKREQLREEKQREQRKKAEEEKSKKKNHQDAHWRQFWR